MTSQRIPHGQPRAISWASVSTGPQADEEKSSLPTQVEENRRNAERLGLRIVDEIIIGGHSRYYNTVDECAADMRAEGIDGFDRIIAHWEARDAEWLLIRDADRIARKLRMGLEFVERLFDAGMKIYSDTDGEKKTYRQALDWIASAGLRAQSNVMFLVYAREKSAPKLAAKGLHPQGVPLKTHRVVKNAKNERVGVEVDLAMRRFLYDAAAIYLEGVSYPKIEAEMHARYGYQKPDGTPLAPLTVYNLLLHPFTWGNTATNYSSRALRKREYPRLGLWIFEAGHDIPDGVTVAYASHEPVFDADIGTQIIAEYERRRGRYQPKPKAVQWASLLFFCDECKRPMSYHISQGVKRYGKDKARTISRAGWSAYLRCVTHNKPSPNYQHCTQTKMLRADKARAAAETWLRAYVEETQAQGEMTDETAARLQSELKSIRAEATRLDDLAKRLVMQRATAPEGSDAYYLELIAAHTAQAKAMDARAATMEKTIAASARITRDREHSFDEIRALDMEKFWSQPAAAINRKLKSLLGELRFAVRDGEVCGMMIDPPRWQTRPRKSRKK